MKVIGRFAPDSYWTRAPGEPDLGKFPVWVDGMIVLARPHHAAGRLWTPSLGFAQKYRDYLYLLLDRLEEPEGFYVWTGWAHVATLPESLQTDPEFTEYVSRYPHVRLDFTESWRTVVDDTPDANLYRVAHIDGSKVEIDRTPGSERIEIYDATLVTRIRIDSTGVLIEVPEEKKVYVGGDGGQALATKEFVASVYANHLHSTPVGLSGPPTVRPPLQEGQDITKKTIAE